MKLHCSIPLLRSLFLLAGILLGYGTAHAERLKVVTRYIEPFSFQKDGRTTGFSIELWDELAREAGIETEYSVANSPAEMVDALKNKTADAAVAALSITSEREGVVDFTQPFYESGLQILVSAASSSSLSAVWQMIKNLFNAQLVGLFLLLLLAMFIVSHLVWRYEHKVNPDMWPEKYRHGLWESFWWTISTLLVGGADNKGPVGVGGRLVAIAWMLLSIVLISFLTASFTTTMTVNSLRGEINGPGDLPGRPVATLAGSTAEKWLVSRGIEVVSAPDLAGAVVALKTGRAKAVVYDAPMLSYFLNQNGDSGLQLAGPIFERQNYGIGVQQDSPLRERLNRALLALTERGFLEELRRKWFGSATAE
jgi:polar amino acid transport system substrate-binding protein